MERASLLGSFRGPRNEHAALVYVDSATSRRACGAMRSIFTPALLFLGRFLGRRPFHVVAGKRGSRNEAFERGFEDILFAGDGDRKEAIFQAAALLDGVVLTRAVQDPRLSDEILQSVRQKVS